jgi:hypothetical protein
VEEVVLAQQRLWFGEALFFAFEETKERPRVSGVGQPERATGGEADVHFIVNLGVSRI